MLLVLEASRLTVLYHGREARLPIGCLSFSPDGRVLAVGSYDSKVYLYAVTHGFGARRRGSGGGADAGAGAEVSLRGICEGCAGRVTAMDFDETSQFLQANDTEGQLVFFSVADGEAMAHPSELRDAKWATHTLPASWATTACWPPPPQPIGQRGSTLAANSDVEPSAAAADPFREVVVVGDTTGRLQLFRFPVPFKDAIPRVSRGHSGPIRQVRFSADGGHVFALGGPDGCLTQWRLVRGETPQTAPSLGPFPVLLQPIADATV
jgi:WD40 repeat protein